MLSIPKKRCFYCIYFLIIFSSNTVSDSYNSFGQVGLINLPSAAIKEEQSIYFTFSKNDITKHGAITVTPFNWLEASFFYNRPEDLTWADIPGLYLDKGFSVKFSYSPRVRYLPKIAIGLDDFAGTGLSSKEYIVGTLKLNNLKVTTGLGWGKFVGDENFIINNPLSYVDDIFNQRNATGTFDEGGSPTYDVWFRGDASFFAGIEYDLAQVRGLSFKLETDPFDYQNYMCCGEDSYGSFELRKKDSNINFGLSYKYKDFGNIDLSFIKGNTLNISFSMGFSSKKPLVKKDKFLPKIKDNNFKQNRRNEFYYDLLYNLNLNENYLQTAQITPKKLEVTIDSQRHHNPIAYSSQTAIISKKVSEFNGYDFEQINISHITRGTQINQISYLSRNINDDYKPISLIKRDTVVNDVNGNRYKNHEFKPRVIFPKIINKFEPDIRTHLGSPEKIMYYGYGIKAVSEIQFSRNLVIHSSINYPIEDNFDRKASAPMSELEHVRTEIVDYLQNTSNKTFISHLAIENIWSPKNNLYAKVSFGLLEQMFGGLSSEILYKPFDSRIAIGTEFNMVKQRAFDQRFKFKEYKTNTKFLNISYYEPKTNILVKWSYGKYLAGDKGYSLDFSRRMPSGWRAGFFFTRTDVSAELFGEGSFDKGFYLIVPHNIFNKGYSKNSTGVNFRPMTRDGGQRLELQNRLIDSFYGSTRIDIEESWETYFRGQ